MVPSWPLGLAKKRVSSLLPGASATKPMPHSMSPAVPGTKGTFAHCAVVVLTTKSSPLLYMTHATPLRSTAIENGVVAYSAGQFRVPITLICFSAGA